MRAVWVAVLCGFVALALTSAASAAGAPAFSWTGFYVGGNVGYSWGKANNTYHAVGNGNDVTTTDSLSVNGPIGGIQGGFNYQFAPMWVGGLEVDWQGSGEKFDGSRVACTNTGTAPTCDTNTVNQSFSEKLSWFSTARGRLGVLVDQRWMIYGTGGVVWGKLQRDDTYTNITTGTVVSTSQSATKDGLVFGFGVEAALWGNLTGRIEYLHFSLPGFGSQHVANGQLDLTQTSDRFRDDILRMALNWKFGP
jgi:outer membrane immunogenic protein